MECDNMKNRESVMIPGFRFHGSLPLKCKPNIISDLVLSVDLFGVLIQPYPNLQGNLASVLQI